MSKEIGQGLSDIGQGLCWLGIYIGAGLVLRALLGH
jgi:hypothetical protein